MRVTYDALGNITSKSDVCATANCMVYGGTAGPHALTSIVGSYNGVTNPTFAYDADGNMASGGGRSVSVTSFNMAASIVDGANSAALTYDTEHQRITQVTTGANAGTTTYLNDPVSGAMSETFDNGASIVSRDYIMADGHMVALRSFTPSTTPPVWGDAATTQWGSFTWTASTSGVTLLYFTLDQLGSISVVTNSTGAVVERDSYDAWGKRRNPDGTPDTSCSIASATTRGFTGQEMMGGVCLINFNARIYDPSLGRFMSADPTTETVYNLQILNRYSYVGNNPLSLTDPSGLCFLGCFWHSSIFKAILSIAVAIVAWEYLPALILGSTEITTTAGVIAAAGANAAAASALAITAGIAGGLSGYISTGTLQGALLGAAQGLAFYGAGNLLQGPAGFTVLGSHDIGALVAHGLVGGLFSVAQGGNFGSGFLAAGIATFAPTPVQGEDFEEVAEGTAESAVLGGIGSVLGGGKFQNGAVTGAFGYLFNEALHATDVGNDAHQTLLDYAKAQSGSFFGNTWTDPGDTTWFGGRPDLGNVNLASLWEIKPFWNYLSGRIQVEFYSIVSGSYSVSEAAPSFFEADTLTLPGKYGTYTYTFMGEGVIGYTSNLNSQNYVVPQFIPLLRNTPKISPLEILRSIPEAAPAL